MQEFYHSKKHKLEDALTELERIYASLDLEKDTMLLDRAERRDYPSYRYVRRCEVLGKVGRACERFCVHVRKGRCGSCALVHMISLPHCLNNMLQFVFAMQLHRNS
jgi:hypothetical protein